LSNGSRAPGISSPPAPSCATNARPSRRSCATGSPIRGSTRCFRPAAPGLTGRDVTVEAHRDVYEKEIDAFAILFTLVSAAKIGTSAVQSRACAGVAGGTYLFALPGSPGACRDAWDEILAPQFDYRHMPCNFVEIMPRLDEHLRRK
jgi:hypothetical protein